MLLSIFISDIDKGVKCTLIKFANDTKMNGVVDTLAGWDVTQRDKLEKWSHENLMRFNKSKGKVLHLGQGNSWYQSNLGDEQIESCPVKKDLGVLWMRSWT
ncbi:rna-directed dna polymerase from mobile element jockey-like [Pitangus sulphuratus]|nr:rna-directed dna polymerase from mobile element jockey-like [Pitangus sulphuratus]